MFADRSTLELQLLHLSLLQRLYQLMRAKKYSEIPALHNRVVPISNELYQRAKTSH